jgi:hypothetical protein
MSDKVKDAKPAARDNGALDPTHFASLPSAGTHVTTGKPKLLSTVTMPDGTVVRHHH